MRMFSGRPTTSFFGVPLDVLKQKLLRFSIFSIVIRVVYLLLQITIGIIIARRLGPAEFGKYSFILSVINILSLFALFGFPGFIVKQFAQYIVQKKFSLIKGLLITSILVSTILSVILLIIWMVLNQKIFYWNLPFERSTLMISSILLPLITLLFLFAAFLRGTGNVISSQLPGSFLRPLFLMIFLSFFLAKDSINAKTILFLNVFSSFIAVLAACIIFYFLCPREILNTKAQFMVSAWLTLSLPFLFLTGALFLNQRVDITMLGFLASPTSVGHYRVAVQLSDSVGVILLGISQVVGPFLARACADGHMTAVRDVLVKSHRFAFTLITIPGIIIIMFRKEILLLVFGAKYLDAALAMTILMLYKVVYAGFCFVGLAFNMLGQAGFVARATLVTVFFNIVLNGLLVPPWGKEGAALATGVSSMVVNIYLVVKFHRNFGFNVTFFGSPVVAGEQRNNGISIR